MGDWLPLPPWYGTCPACEHDWREHGADGPACSQCEYEMYYQLPGAPTSSCEVPAPDPP